MRKVEKSRDILVALKAAYVLGLLTIAMAAVAAGQRNSPGRLEQEPMTPAPVFGVSGVVLDPSNAAIAGAKVTLHGGSVENEPSTTTDLSGHFQFSGVSPGSYEVEVQQEGFKILKSRVKVGPRSSAPLRIVLPLRELHEEVTVTNPQDQLSRDATENADIIRLDRQALDSLPILDNDIVKAVTEMLGPGSGGAVVTVDGMTVSDVGVPASAIQEVRINQNPYSAEYAAPGKNRIEIITKNGSSDFHGSLETSFRDYRLDARNAFAGNRPPEHLSLFDGYFSGPLGNRKKTTFQVSASQKQDDQQAIVYAQLPTGTFSQNFSNPQRSTYFLVGINRELGKGNTLAIRYSYFNWSDKGNGVGGVNLPEAASDESSRRHYLYLNDRAAITPNLLNEFSVRATTSDSITRSVLQGQPRIVVLDAFVGGSGQTNYNELHNYLQLNDTVSWSHGKHLIKTGINLPEFGGYNLNDRSNFDGTFQFSSLQDYLQSRPFSFVLQQGTSQLVYWFRIPRTLLRASHSLSLQGNPERSYFAVAQGSSTRLPARRPSPTCCASMVKPYNRSSSRIRVTRTHSRPVVWLRPFQTALSALHQIFVCLTTCSTA